MNDWLIAAAVATDGADWAAMRAELWREDGLVAHQAEVARRFADARLDRLVLIARLPNGAPAGFTEAAVRRDHVNGCESSPALFLEGIFVAPAAASRGLGRALVGATAAWGRERGLTEFASDATLDDPTARAFHRAVGFVETERVVFFRRALD